MENSIVSFDELWSEIKKAHDTTFIEKIIEIPNANIYAFGGIIYDLSLGRKWKDLDVRVILDLPTEERDKAVEDILKEHASIIQNFKFPDGTVIRVKVPGEKDMIIDVGISNNFEKFRGDFKACSIFVNLKTGEIVELGEGCVDDFQNKIIRALDDPEPQLEDDPTHLLRALKFAAKTGFLIDPEFERILKNKKSLVRRVINDVTSHLKENGKDSISEYFLGNIFGGLKARADVYVDLLEEYGFLEEMCTEIQQLVCNEDKKEIELEPGSGKLFEGLTQLEDKISVFLSVIAKAISNDPENCFEKIKKVFSFDTTRSDGNEFVVDPDKIKFIA